MRRRRLGGSGNAGRKACVVRVVHRTMFRSARRAGPSPIAVVPAGGISRSRPIPSCLVPTWAAGSGPSPSISWCPVPRVCPVARCIGTWASPARPLGTGHTASERRTARTPSPARDRPRRRNLHRRPRKEQASGADAACRARHGRQDPAGRAPEPAHLHGPDGRGARPPAGHAAGVCAGTPEARRPALHRRGRGLQGSRG